MSLDSIKPGESRTLAFELGPEELHLLDRKWNWRVEPGDFKVMAGASSEDIRLTEMFTVQ